MSNENIGGVAETMLQTLYARAKESQKPNHKIYDARAIEIVSQMDYDFTLADKDAAMSSGVVARRIVLDRMVSEYVKEYPEATVINIACGMDTRFYRVDNGKISWYNIDLPVTMEVRERYIREDERVTNLAASAMDESWAEQIQTTGGSILVIIEGLSMYLTEGDVKQVLSIINNRFSKVTVYMEILNPKFVRRNVEKSIQQSGAVFTWGVKNGGELARLCPVFQWQGDRSLVEGMVEIAPIYKVLGKIGAIRNLSNKIAVLEKKGQGMREMSTYNDIGIGNTLGVARAPRPQAPRAPRTEVDWKRIRKLMIIGIFAGCMVMAGDMLLGYGVHDPGKGGLEGFLSAYLDLPDSRIFWSAMLGMIGIPPEGLCYFAIYRLIASGSMHYAHLYRTGIFGYLIFGGCGVHVPCLSSVYVYKHLMEASPDKALELSLRFGMYFLLPAMILFLIFWVIHSYAQIAAFSKGLTPYPKWCWIFCLPVGQAITMLLKFTPETALRNALTAGWISIANIWTMGGLLITMKYARRADKI